MLPLLAGCSGSPAGPTAPPPSIACPSNIEAQARHGEAPVVTFNTPVAQGGAAPVTVTCSPASGSQFAVGATQVTCTAIDAERRAASCGFSVSVEAIPTLSRVKFLAFGDSITAGTTSDPLSLALVLAFEDSYPYKLEQLLRARYIDQDVIVVNAGVGGERIEPDGRRRLTRVLDAERPDVLLLLDGANDLLCAAGSTAFTGYPACGHQDPFAAIPVIVGALEAMVNTAQSSDIRVLLANFPPQDASRQRGAGAPAVPDLNAEIAGVAGRTGATLVDLFNGLGGTPASAIGVDGLHPTAAGYDRIAELWFDVIRREFERPAQAVVPTLDVKRRPATIIR